MRSRPVILFLLAGVAPAVAQAPAEEWVFRGGDDAIVLEERAGILTQLESEGAKDHTLRSWPVDLDASQIAYLDKFTTEDSSLEFSPSFRIIVTRNGHRAGRRGARDADFGNKTSGIVTYRYDMRRRAFAVRRGLGG